MENKLHVQDLRISFRTGNGKVQAVRGIDFDLAKGETLAIVGESGSGKSVLTKTFAGMTDSNGFIDEGRLILNDPELAETYVKLTSGGRQLMKSTLSRLNSISGYELGVETYRKMRELEAEKKSRESLSEEERAAIENELGDMKFKRANLFNEKQTYDPRHEKDRIKAADRMLKEYGEKIKALESKEAAEEKARKAEAAKDTAFIQRYNKQMAELKAKYEQEIKGQISEETKKRNEILSKEIHLSVGRYGLMKRLQLTFKLLAVLKQAMQTGVDLDDEEQRNAVFDKVAFRVKYLDETSDRLHGICVLNLANVKYARDWQQIRGRRIATVFQDPMTSLNPIVTIGKQITSVIMRHQGCSETEARRRAIELMHKVGIPNAESRFDDYPFQYSGGMRQRIVIAIALSCQPKILICDEPTTALDVTIQAQILQLIKDLQKEFGFTTVFITHDLGVVANVADRVAVLYAGQMVEVGTAEEVFYDPRHPYTWALLSSLPQLAQRNTELYSITGTPPSLYNSITGDAFAPRNPYCLKIDTLEEPPMFRVTDTHYAKTWLLDPRSAKVEKPEGIRDIHNKLMEAFNI